MGHNSQFLIEVKVFFKDANLFFDKRLMVIAILIANMSMPEKQAIGQKFVTRAERWVAFRAQSTSTIQLIRADEQITSIGLMIAKVDLKTLAGNHEYLHWPGYYLRQRVLFFNTSLFWDLVYEVCSIFKVIVSRD